MNNEITNLNSFFDIIRKEKNVAFYFSHSRTINTEFNEELIR